MGAKEIHVATLKKPILRNIGNKYRLEPRSATAFLLA